MVTYLFRARNLALKDSKGFRTTAVDEFEKDEEIKIKLKE